MSLALSWQFDLELRSAVDEWLILFFKFGNTHSVLSINFHNFWIYFNARRRKYVKFPFQCPNHTVCFASKRLISQKKEIVDKFFLRYMNYSCRHVVLRRIYFVNSDDSFVKPGSSLLRFRANTIWQTHRKLCSMIPFMITSQWLSFCNHM